MKKRIEVSSESGISMPIKNLISIVGAVAVGVWAYFGVVERLNRLESDNRLMHKDCLLYTSPSPRDNGRSRMPSSA